MQDKRRKFQEIALFLLIGIIATLAFFPLNPDLYPYAGRDSSAFALVAKGMLSGKVPYLDLWDHKPPMIYFINLIGLLISPGSFWGIYIIEVLFLIVSVLLLINTTKRQLLLLELLFLGVFFIQLNLRLSSGGNSTSFYPQVFQLGLVYLVSQGRSGTQNPRRLLLIGCFAATVLLFRQTSLGIFAAWLVFDIVRNAIHSPGLWLKKTGSWLFVGFISVALPITLYLLITNSFDHFLDQAFIFNKYYIDDRTRQEFIDSAFSHLHSLSKLGILPFALLGVVAICWRKIIKREIDQIDYILCISFGFDWILLLSGGRPREMYELALLPSMILLGYRFLFYIKGLHKNSVIYKLTIIIACLLISYRLYGDYIFTISQGKNLEAEKSQVIEFIEVNTKQGDTILVWGAESWAYFYSDRYPPTKYFYQYPLFYEEYAHPEKVEEFYSDVFANKPKVIIGTISKGKITDGFGNSKTPLTEKLAGSLRMIYSPVKQVGEWTIYQLVD